MNKAEEKDTLLMIRDLQFASLRKTASMEHPSATVVSSLLDNISTIDSMLEFKYE